jgi:hypothetical protein
MNPVYSKTKSLHYVVIVLHVLDYEICALRGCYVASCGNCSLTFRDNVSHRMGLIRFPEMLVNNYHTTPCNIPQERRSHQRRGGSLNHVLD